MAKGPVITDKVKQIIADVYRSHPDWRAKEVHYEVSQILRDNSPGLSAIQKQLTIIRRLDNFRSSESKELDEVWSIGSSLKYDIPSEVIPTLLQIRKSIDGLSEHPITNRQARWIARLHSLTQNIETLHIWSIIYGNMEWHGELMGVEYHTFEIDNIIIDENIIILKNLLEGTIKIPENINDELHKFMIRREQSAGLNLPTIDFPVNACIPYIFHLGQTIFPSSWSKKSKKEQRETILNLRNSITEERPRKGFLFALFLWDIEFAIFIMKIIKEVQDERPHSKEV
ncbi:hypothetical protein ACFLTT_00140 [Chloroflexota bacterium]